MMFPVLTLVLLTSSYLNAQSASRGAAGWQALYEPQPSEKMPYRLMKPLGFDSAKSYPVIISLHGAGGKGSDNKKQLKDWNGQLAAEKVRNQYPCYVVAPQSDRLWDEEHFNEIKRIISELPSVDMKRIYILGHSMGGHGTYIFTQIEPTYFAAAAPSAGSGLKRTEAFIDASKLKDLPIWAFHGDKDGVCPIEKDRKVFEEMKKLGGNMKLTTFAGDNHGISGKMIPGADNGSTEYSSDRCDKEPDFLKWLFSQKRTD
jgi:predicted peptidase